MLTKADFEAAIADVAAVDRQRPGGQSAPGDVESGRGRAALRVSATIFCGVFMFDRGRFPLLSSRPN